MLRKDSALVRSLIEGVKQILGLRNLLLLVVLAIGACGLLYFPRPAFAATKTWTGAAGTDWNDPLNWDTGVPTNSDLALFNSGSNPATINVTIDVGGLQITSGYTGTITQSAGANITLHGFAPGSSSYDQAGGTFNGSSGTITYINHFVISGGTFNASSGTITILGLFTQSGGSFNGGSGNIDFNSLNNFTLAGGTFTAPSGILSVNNGFIDSGGTFFHNNGTVTFDSVGGPGITNSDPFNNLNFDSGTNFVGTLVVVGALSLNGGSINNGTVEARGAVTLGAGFSGGTGTLIFANGAVPRTITFAAGVSLPHVDLNDPDVTIQVSGSGTLNWVSLKLQSGTINQGTGAFSFSDSYNQSGGTFNASSGPITFNHNFLVSGGTFNGGSGNIDVNVFSGTTFTLSGGTFNASSGVMSFEGNFFHTAGGVFNHNNGTVNFDSIGGPTHTNSDPFNNLNFNTGSNFVGALVVQGALSFNGGTVHNGTVEARGNASVANTFAGGSAAIFFAGTANQLYSNSGGINPTGAWTINKSGGAVTAANSILLDTTQALNITSGTLYLNNNSNLTCGALSIGPGGRLVNDSSTTITLGGNVVNNGRVDLQGGGAACPETDSILLRSSVSGTRRNWSGAGSYRMVDVDVRDMGGATATTPAITVFSGTDSGNNNSNWTFNNNCPPELSIAPLTANVFAGSTQSFTAGGGFPPRTFSLAINNSNGSINAASGLYTAGATANTTDTVRVTDAFGNTADATVNVAGPTQLSIVVQPSNATAGQAIAPSIQVAIQDQLGNTDTSATNSIAISIQNNAGSGTLSGTLTRNAVSGIATFNNLSINRSGAEYTLRAASGGLTSATTDPFNINAGPASQLVFITQPSHTNAFEISSSVQVAFQDALGNIAAPAFGAIDIGLLANPGSSLLSGTKFAATVNGVATFDDLWLNRVGDGYTLRAVSLVEGFEVVSSPFNITRPIFIVTNTTTNVDELFFPKTGSLTQAIFLANDLPGTDTINFNISGIAPFTITPFNPLPTITDSLIIDGTSQPGFVGSPIIELNGAAAGEPPSASGLEIVAGNCTVRGLVINNFIGAGISLLSNGGNTIQGNYIGTNLAGDVARPNGDGVYIVSSDNLIGGNTAATRNVISGNGFSGVTVTATGNVIRGNFIGTNAGGTTAVQNRAGVFFAGPGNITVGGTQPGEGNVVSGNVESGIRVASAVATATVNGNYIGTDASGAVALLDSQQNKGIEILGSTNVIIGGTSPGEANVVAFNLGKGVEIDSFSTRVAVRGNSIHSNGSLGIDLFPNGVNMNDDYDFDSGANQRQNYPVLTSAVSTSGATDIQGTLNSFGPPSFTLDFYSNPLCHPSGYGEGQTYLGSTNVSTDPAGVGVTAFTINLPVTTTVGQFIVVAATDPLGNTSEFSQCRVVTGLPLSISGRVVDNNNNALRNTQLLLSGGQTAAIITDSNGNYSFDNLAGGAAYTVTPLGINSDFTPVTRSYPNLTTSQSNQDFIATKSRYTVSGSLRANVGGILFPLSGVTVTLSGAAARTTTANGAYFFADLSVGGYTVTPSKDDYVFTPPSANVTITNSDQPLSFTAIASSPLEGRIVFQSPSSGGIGSINADGTAFYPSLIARPAIPGSISRDGKKLVYRRTNPLGLFSSNADGSNEVQLTFGNQDSSPEWSPDGTKIAFLRFSPSSGTISLRIINVANLVESPVTVGPLSRLRHPTWLTNSRLAFSAYDGNDIEIYAVNANGTFLSKLTNNSVSDSDPAASPDGTKIAFINDPTPSVGPRNLMVMNLDGTGPQTIRSDLHSIQTNATWSPDGSKLAYLQQFGASGVRLVSVNSANGSGLQVILNVSNLPFDLNLPYWGPRYEFATPIGSNVNIDAGGAKVGFANVASPGTTTFTPLSPSAAGTAPSGFVLSNRAYEISTTVAYLSPVTVCFKVPVTIAPTPAAFNALSLMHNEGGALLDKTTSRDFNTRTICGSVTTLSPFVLAEQTGGPGFSAKAEMPSITGLVQDSSGDPLAGMSVQLSGTETRTAETDAFGIFHFVNLTEGGNYNVQPKLTGYLFTEYSQDFVNLAGEKTIVFRGTQSPFLISGKAVDQNGNGVSGVEISLEGSTTGLATTDQNGDYLFTDLPADGALFLAAFKDGFGFTPGQQVIDPLTSDQTEVNFIAGPPACAFGTSPSSQFFSMNGGSGSVNVVTGTSCSWTALASDSWITIVSADNGTGDGVVDFEVRENFTSSARQATINISGQLLTIVQDGGLGDDCNYSISPGFQSFSAAGGSELINVTAEDRCAWQAASSAPWVTIISNDVGIGNGSVSYNVATNPGPGGRAATITIGGKVFAVKQKGP